MEVRYVWGTAYDALTKDAGDGQIAIRAAKMSPEALNIIKKCKMTGTSFTQEEREVIYNDEAVRLTRGDVERGHYLRNQPICDTHKHQVGHIVESIIQGTCKQNETYRSKN